MRLVDLNPQFYRYGGEGLRNARGDPIPERLGVGLSCDCPCGCGARMAVAFANPIRGGEPVINPGENTWQREGDTFETLTLTPSIQRADPGGCRWHGFLTNGEFRSC